MMGSCSKVAGPPCPRPVRQPVSGGTALHVAEPQANTSNTKTERVAVLYPARNRGKRTLTPEDLWKFQRTGAPVPAPDGSFVLAPVTTYDMEENRGRTRLWMVPREGEPRPLTAE